MSDITRLPGGGYRLPPITITGNLPRDPFGPSKPPPWRPPPPPPPPRRPPVVGPIPGMPQPGFRDGDAARRQAEQARDRARVEAERARQEEARRAQQQREQQRRQDEATRAANQRNQQLRQQELDRQRRMQEQQRSMEQQRQQQQREQQQRQQEQQRQRDLARQQEAARQRQLTEAQQRQRERDVVVQGRRPAPRPRRAVTPQAAAEAKVVSQETALTNSAAAEARLALSDAERVGAAVPHLTEEARDGVPLDLLLGWIAKESSGKLGDEERTRQANNPDYTLDEISLFQISVEERELYLKLKPAARARMLTDMAFSVKQGIRLAKFYQGALEQANGVSTESPAVWQLVKLSHKVGLPSVKRLLGKMADATVDPATASWRDIKTFVAGHPRSGVTLDQMSRVDVVMLRGQTLSEHFDSGR